MRLCYFIPFLLIAILGKTQSYPSDKIMLNHLQVMFEFVPQKKADAYRIQIALGSSSFNQPLYEAVDSSCAHLVAQVLQFNTSYQWRFIALSQGKIIFTSSPMYFQTAKTPLTHLFRANVSGYDSTKAQDGVIFLDHGLVIDRKGNLVLISDSFGVEKRDFSLTLNGSISYVQNTNAFDRTLNGEVIWQSAKLSVSTTTVYGYHHDVTKLSTGNYLVMCRIREKDTTRFRKNLDEGILEVDAKNTVKWLWKEHEHISDTCNIKTTHSNSVFLDETENKVYVSSRDINTIFVINRTSGDIEKCIGRKIANNAEHYPQAWFAGQHSAQLLSSGNILLFNNNAHPPKPGLPSSILEINNPSAKNKDITPAFLYIYDFEKGENHCAKGGDVNKLKNSNYIISSSAFNRNFEIDANSEIVWQCRPEKYDSLNKTWIPIGSYRINFEESLYPSFFCIDKLYSKGKLSGYKITNKGTRDDEYTITIKSFAGKIINESKIKISAGNYSKQILPASGVKIVSVVSKSNPRKEKQIKID